MYRRFSKYWKIRKSRKTSGRFPNPEMSPENPEIRKCHIRNSGEFSYRLQRCVHEENSHKFRCFPGTHSQISGNSNVRTVSRTEIFPNSRSGVFKFRFLYRLIKCVKSVRLVFSGTDADFRKFRGSEIRFILLHFEFQFKSTWKNLSQKPLCTRVQGNSNFGTYILLDKISILDKTWIPGLYRGFRCFRTALRKWKTKT
jgi:hypothetical protein